MLAYLPVVLIEPVLWWRGQAAAVAGASPAATLLRRPGEPLMTGTHGTVWFVVRARHPDLIP